MSENGALADKTPLPEMLARLLQRAIKTLLNLDPGTRARLATLKGKSVVLHIDGLDLRFMLLATAEGVEVSSKPDAAGDALLKGTPMALFAMSRPEWFPADMDTGHIEMSGDVRLARQIEAILKRLDPDWEEPLAKVFGDTLGHLLFRGLKQGAEFGKRTLDTLLKDSSEYLREESRDLVSHPEMDRFLDDVDGLRDRVERLIEKADTTG